MSEPFIGEIRMSGFNFAPRGYAMCDGQTLPINQNQALFSLLGVIFGGDGRTNFKLPDLRGRAPMHAGGFPGANGGQEAVTLNESQIPPHRHGTQATSDAATDLNPDGKVFATAAGGRAPLTPFGAAGDAALNSLSATGGQGHNNMQPYLPISFYIALTGIFPPRN